MILPDITEIGKIPEHEERLRGKQCCKFQPEISVREYSMRAVSKVGLRADADMLPRRNGTGRVLCLEYAVGTERGREHVAAAWVTKQQTAIEPTGNDAQEWEHLWNCVGTVRSNS